MEQVTNIDNLNSILGNLQNKKDVTRFKSLVETLYIHCMHLDVNQSNVSESNVESNISSLKHLERLSLYLFSEYKNLLKVYSEELTNNAMQICALSFEKIGDYLEHINPDELTHINQTQILKKQIRAYWKSAIAYSICNNPPNSYVVTKKIKKVLEQLINLQVLSPDKIDLYYISYFVLSRNFVNNIESYVEDSKLRDIFNSLKEYIGTGNVEYAKSSVDKIKNKINKKLNNYETNYYWHLKYIQYTIETIIDNCVWNNLSNVFSREYILQLIKSKPSIIELWPNQLQVINNLNGFLRDDDIKRTLINFPTSGGKSLLAELAIVKELERDDCKKCFYIVPTNALVYEVTKRLRERFRRLGYKVSNSVSGYEPELISKMHVDDNVIVTTPEKLDTIIRNNLSENILDDISLIVFDEFHKIQDKQRGWLIEGSITFLINHESYSDIKLIFLSAIMDNGQVILDWVDNTKLISDYAPSDWKPTIMLKGIANVDYKKNERGSWISIPKEHDFYNEDYKNYFAQADIRYRIDGREPGFRLFEFPKYHFKKTNKIDKSINLKRENLIMAVAQKFKNVGGSLIFFHTKEDCENFVSDYQPFFPEKHEISREVEYLIKYIEKRLGKNHLLTIGLTKGIVYHHGSLPIDIREALEDYYLKGYIKIIVCTTTLVEGVNFPIQNFIHSGRKYPGQKTITSGDFKNIAGRAGRAYQSTYGQIIHINFYKNIISEHLNFEEHQNLIESSILENEEFLKSINKLEVMETEEYDNFLISLSKEPFTKSLLVFYNSLSTEVDDVLHFIDNSLFAKQIEQDKLESIKKLSKKMYYFYDKHSKKELIKIQESGLSFKSFEIVKALSREVIDSINDGNKVQTVKQFISAEMYYQILELDESKKYEVRKTTATSRILNIDDYNLLIDWVESNKNLNELSVLYFKDVEDKYRMMRIVEYVKDMFEFKLPWIIGTLSKMVIDEVGDSEYIRNLPLFIKYGVNQVIDINLFRLGLNSRETVKDISKYLQENTTLISVDEVREYLKNIDPLVFLENIKGITPFEVRKLVTLTSNFKKVTNLFNNKNGVDTYVAGTKYYLCQLKERDKIIGEVKAGEHLTLKRENMNFYDNNAVEVFYKGYKLGYISRDVNEEVAYYLDLNSDYKLIIENIKVVDINKYIEIKIRLSFNIV